MRKSTKIVAAVGGAALVVATAGTAYAYFTSSGSGTGNATVGSADSWDVSPASPVGSMYPGSGSSVITFTVKNTGSGKQAVSSAAKVTAALVASAGNIVHSGAAVSGCTASWFTPTVGAPSVAYGTSIAHDGTFTVDVTVAMTDSGTNQDACQGATPDVTLSIAAG